MGSKPGTDSYITLHAVPNDPPVQQSDKRKDIHHYDECVCTKRSRDITRKISNERQYNYGNYDAALTHRNASPLIEIVYSVRLGIALQHRAIVARIAPKNGTVGRDRRPLAYSGALRQSD